MTSKFPNSKLRLLDKNVLLDEIVKSNAGKDLQSYDNAKRVAAFETLEIKLSNFQDLSFDIDNYLRLRLFQLKVHELYKNIFDEGFQNIYFHLVNVIISESKGIIDGKIIYKNEVICEMKKNDDEKSKIDEVVSGLAVNRLREFFPHFQFTYGIKTIKNDSYIALERIKGSKLRDVADKLTFDELMAIFFQLVNAINLAWEECDYTHFNLNLDTVYLEVYENPISIPFYYRKFKYFITSKYLARITDFRTSFIKITSKSFNRATRSSFPVHDMISFLIDLNRREFDKIFDYCRQRSILRDGKIIKDGNVTLDRVLFFIKNNYDLSSFLFEDETGTPTTCGENPCMDWETFEEEYFDSYKKPDNIEEFMENLNKIKDNEYKKKVMKWLNSK